MHLLKHLFGPTTRQLQEVKLEGTLVHISQQSTTMVGIYSVCRRWVEVVVDCPTSSIVSIRQIDSSTLAKYLPEHFLSALQERLR